MAQEGKNIKDYTNNLWLFIIANLVVYLCLTSSKIFDLGHINETYKGLLIKNGIIASTSTLITFILNGLLPSNVKVMLAFWRIKNAYPGCRIFTKLIAKDPRIDKDILAQMYGELPIDPVMQNKLWYQIFKSMEFDPMIFDSHRNFLLSRDLTGLSFIFFFIYSAAALISKIAFNINFNWLAPYILVLLIQYVVLSIVSRNYGNRFACNVLAKACSTYQKNVPESALTKG
ncbi:MAG: hypothetical protein PWQ70_1629 [Clostridiales bacterium]|nr:hypothetical protein [Clostridiales bacterium]